jgi:hypothetical protein
MQSSLILPPCLWFIVHLTSFRTAESNKDALLASESDFSILQSKNGKVSFSLGLHDDFLLEYEACVRSVTTLCFALTPHIMSGEARIMLM